MTDRRDDDHDHDDATVTPFRSRGEDGGIVRLVAANDSAAGNVPVFNLPPAIKALCLSLFTVALAQAVLPERAVYDWAFVPARYGAGMEWSWQAVLSPVTALFIHGGVLHLLMNLGMLMAFGAGVEKVMGPRRMLALYISSGVAGMFSHAVFYHDSAVPVVGASGAISGLFGAIVIMMHDSGLTGGGGFRRLLPFIGVWIAISLFFGVFGVPGSGGDIAWATHIGGFLAGMAFYKMIGHKRI